MPETPVCGWAGYAIGFGAAVAVTAVTDHPLWTLGALAALTGALATTTALRAALATAAVCWALYVGFVLDRFGELRLSAESVWAAALLAAVALAGYGAGIAVRAGRELIRRTVRGYGSNSSVSEWRAGGRELPSGGLFFLFRRRNWL